ncbi:unnamed protein product [Durusdinium trenchii]|uniref:Uncharacterized protein n=2 Tax=Durusdinium trenchii TaxID=1381693 RepID=A0ABP0IU43_9DINO
MASSKAAFFLYLGIVQGSCFLAILLQLLGFNVSHGWVAARMLQILQVKFGTALAAQQVMDNGRPVVYLSNHRSWGDFWTDAALLAGPSFISRAMVAAAIPWTALWGSNEGWLWFFSRGSKHKEGAVAWMKHFLSERIKGFAGKGVVLYPEGTRSLLPEGLPLKLGALGAAYELQWPVQVVITTNKECVTAEREMAVNFGTLCVSSVSRVIDPGTFASMEAFIEVVKETWRKTWKEAYSPDFQLRTHTALPGAHLPTLRWSPKGPWRLQVVRLLLLALAYLLFKRWRAKREVKKDDKQDGVAVNCDKSSISCS